MPAAPADIAAGMRASVTVDWSDPAVKARYSSARDDNADPAPGWFDAAADAQIAVAARGAIFGVERRRFTLTLAAPLWLDPSLGLPQLRLIDAELSADLPTIAPKYLVDLDAERTTLEVIG